VDNIHRFYLYNAYQKEQENNKNKPTNAKKPYPNPSKLPEIQVNKEKTFQDILAELEAGLYGKSEELELPKAEISDNSLNYKSTRDEINIKNKNTDLESIEDANYEEKRVGYVNQYIDNYKDNYKDNYEDNYINLQDKIDSIEAKDVTSKSRIKQVNIEDYNPLETKKVEKFIKLNNKKISAKDLFLAQMILEKKV
jgi:hypothetical protein